MKRLVLFLVLVIFQSEAIVNHNPVKPGCPPVVTPKENLLLERFSGVWYEIQKYSNQFELGTCISINIGFVRELNASTVSIRHNQKVGDNFTDFDQTAQVKSLNSVWSFKNNSSLIGDNHIHTSGKLFILYFFCSRRWWIYLHTRHKLCELCCNFRVRNHQQEAKWTNGITYYRLLSKWWTKFTELSSLGLDFEPVANDATRIS